MLQRYGRHGVTSELRVAIGDFPRRPWTDFRNYRRKWRSTNSVTEGVAGSSGGGFRMPWNWRKSGGGESDGGDANDASENDGAFVGVDATKVLCSDEALDLLSQLLQVRANAGHPLTL